MCGIIAYTGKQDAAPILMHGLRQLEYRGYDSAGISVANRGKLNTHKAAGKLDALAQTLPKKIAGKCGIGHTRWATHGEPNDVNSHPHCASLTPDSSTSIELALVHNGIIENADALRIELKKNGMTTVSETDSEVLVQLIAYTLANNSVDLFEATRLALLQVRGTYGLAIIDQQSGGEIVVARNASPVIIGIGDGEMFAASDTSAMSRYTREVTHLEDGEIARLTAKGFEVQTLAAQPAEKTSFIVESLEEEISRGNFSHFMHKEILEQPDSVKRSLSGRLDTRFNTSHLGGLNLTPRELLGIKRLKLLGCGTAYYAGLCGANMIESLARLPSDAEPAAEFRYRNPLIEPETLYIAISQSGETFDTLAAVREVKRKGGKVLGIVNSIGSSIAREVDGGIYMHAGPEVSVASTKAYSSMLAVLALLALQLGRIRDVSVQQGALLLSTLEGLPELLQQTLELEDSIKALAAKYCNAQSAFFIGRTDAYPVALEGAQKLKEISYIHAEAYPASELKHGPLALITPETPCVVILPDDDLLDKSIATLHEIKTRGGPVIAVTNSTDERIQAASADVILVPPCHQILHANVLAIPLQLFAYHCALKLEREVDQPRNLAKSVTVE